MFSFSAYESKHLIHIFQKLMIKKEIHHLLKVLQLKPQVDFRFSGETKLQQKPRIKRMMRMKVTPILYFDWFFCHIDWTPPLMVYMFLSYGKCFSISKLRNRISFEVFQSRVYSRYAHPSFNLVTYNFYSPMRKKFHCISLHLERKLVS